MADLSDVEQAVLSLIAGVVYPFGISASTTGGYYLGFFTGGSPGSATGDQVRLYRGWPQSANLDADLKAGITNISIFSRGGVERNTTRYPVDYQTVSVETPTVTVSVNPANGQITIGGAGSATVSQYVTILLGPRSVVSYAVKPTDTATTIAAALAALISAQFFGAKSSGPVITLSFGVNGYFLGYFSDGQVTTSAYIQGLVGVTGNQIAETRRQRTQLQITLWCPNPTVRDNLAKLIEPVLSLQTFITMPDQSAARFRYHNTIVSDEFQKVALYRRDLIYEAEYATTVADTASEVTAIVQNVAGGLAPALGPVNTNIMPVAPQTPPINSPNPFSPHVPD